MSDAAKEALAVAVLRSVSELRDASAAWDALAERASGGNPFVTPDWTLAWLETDPELTPFVLTARRAGQLVAVWAFGLRQVTGARRLEYVEGDVYGVLAGSEDGPAAARAFATTLVAHRDEWDVAVLSEHLVAAPSARWVREAATQAGLPWTSLPASGYPYVDLVREGSLAAYEKRIGKKVINEIKRRRKQLEGLGPVRIERVRSRADVLARFPAIVELHQKRWRERSDTSGFSSPLRIEGMRRAAERFAQASRLELDVLLVDGVLVAYSYGFVFGGRHIYYSPGFDPAYAPFSVSKILLQQQLSDAFADGLTEFDFSRGAEPYKLVWASGSRQGEVLVMHHEGLRSRLAGAAAIAGLKVRFAAKENPRLVHFKRETLGKVRSRVSAARLRARATSAIDTLRRSVGDRGAWGTTARLVERATARVYTQLDSGLYEQTLDGPITPVSAPTGVTLGSLQPAEYAQLVAGGRYELADIVRRHYDGHRCFVARDGDSVVSYAWAQSGPRVKVPELGRDLELESADVYLGDCYTLPAHRGRGLYVVVLRHALAASLAGGKKRAFIVAETGNAASTRGIERAGFRLKERVEWRGWRRGATRCRPALGLVSGCRRATPPRRAES